MISVLAKNYDTIHFQTLTCSQFNKYHKMFYVNGVKVVPLDIRKHLTARGLAFGAMDDGSIHSPGFYLCTNCFTIPEVELLCHALAKNFWTYHRHSPPAWSTSNFIRANDMPVFRAIVTPHFHPTMLYKLA